MTFRPLIRIYSRIRTCTGAMSTSADVNEPMRAIAGARSSSRADGSKIGSEDGAPPIAAAAVASPPGSCALAYGGEG